jgi:hypothetical protein
MAAKEDRRSAPKTTEKACTCDGHQGIPRDAAGVPVYLILPDNIRSKYERKMAACEKAWRQTGDAAAYMEATTWSWSHRQPIPTWLHNAILKSGVALRTPQQIKDANTRHEHHTRYRAVMDARYDYVRVEDGRYKLVVRRNNKGRPVSLQKAYEAAAVICKCEWPMVKRSYRQVRADLDRGFGGRYFIMKTPNLKALAKYS